MNLQNGYKVIYEKIADGNERTFYATKTAVCDPAVDDVITTAEIGKYKLIYEKDGQLFGSTTGIPAEGDYCFTTENFKKVFIDGYVTEEPAAYTGRAREAVPENGEPAAENPVVVEDDE